MVFEEEKHRHKKAKQTHRMMEMLSDGMGGAA